MSKNKCPLCDSTNTKYSFTTNEFHGHYVKNNIFFKYYICNACLAYFPDISKININNFYGKNYRHKISLIEKLLVFKNLVYSKILIFNLFHNKKISVLDVGCGSGYFLNNLSNKYFKTGIDIKIDTKQKNLIEGDFLTHKFNSKYDLITFNHSLEHLQNLIKAIKKAKKILNKYGKIIISILINNCCSFIFNSQKAFHLDPPRHIFIPNSIKLKEILKKYFTKVTIKSNFFEFPLDLYWSLKNSQKKFLIPMFPILKILKPETNIFICQK